MGHLANFESGFYSCYFFVPKKDDGLRPILDLSTYEMAIQDRWTLKQILSQVLSSGLVPDPDNSLSQTI